MDVGDDVSPELERLEHVGLVDAAQLLAALGGSLEGDVRDAADFRLGVAHSVETFARAGEQPVGRRAHAARLAEVNVAIQLTHDQDVQTGNDFRLEARCAGQLGVADRRTEIGEQLQVLAQAQNGLLRAQFARQRVVLPVAHGAEQDGVGFLGELERVFRQRMALGLVARAAHRGEFHLERLAQRLEHLHGLGDDFLANAVTRQHCNLGHVVVLVVLVPAQPTSLCASHGILARRCAS